VIVQALGVMAVLSLGSADSFSILGGSGVTATGTMRVTGNVGAGTGGVRGVSPVVGAVVPGGDALNDVTAALKKVATQPCITTSLSGQVGPGVYCVTTIDGPLEFRGDGLRIFSINSGLTTQIDSSMRLLDGAKSSHIFWLVSGSATLRERSTFIGTLIAQQSINVQKGVTVAGRLIARQGSVTLTTDDINLCCDPDDGTTHTFSLFDGKPPPDVTINGDGTYSGHSTTPGTYTFIVLAEDANGCTRLETRTLVVCDKTTVEPSTLPDAAAGSAYSVRITTTPSGTHVFTTTPLPDVMTLTSASCAPEALLCGTPKAAGSYKFTITATDCQNGCSGSREYTLNVVCPAITVFPSALDGGTVGIVYRKVLTASGSLEPYTFTAEPSIPPGVTVDSSGVLSFTPDKPGDYSIKVKATDTHGCSGTRDYTIKVCPTITITPASLPPAFVKIPFSQQLGGASSFTAAPLPEWLKLTTAGLLCAPHPVAGDYSFIVTGTSFGCSVDKNYTLHVSDCAITISPSTLTRGTLLVPYNQVIAVSRGTPPYTIAVKGNVPPFYIPPLTLSGIPTAITVYNFTVMATDAQGCSAEQDYHIAIDPPLVPGAIVPTLSDSLLLMLAIALAFAGVVLTRRGAP